MTTDHPYLFNILLMIVLTILLCTVIGSRTISYAEYFSSSEQDTSTVKIDDLQRQYDFNIQKIQQSYDKLSDEYNKNYQTLLNNYNGMISSLNKNIEGNEKAKALTSSLDITLSPSI